MRGPNPQQRFQKLGLGVLTVPYGGKTREEAVHPGVDIANNKGTPIHAPVEGIVTKVDGGHMHGENNFGNTVELKDAQGLTHQFHHLHNIGVKPGQTVGQEQPIATMGDSGSTYSPSNSASDHLDYRIVDSYNRYKNPSAYLKNL